MLRYCLIILYGLVLIACASAPVQQMSDARQAIDVARQAGAGEYAPESMRQADAFLERAQQKLEMGFYRGAKENAEWARKRAVEAMQQASDERK